MNYPEYISTIESPIVDGMAVQAETSQKSVYEKKTLYNYEAVKLWRLGRDAWNKWSEKHEGWTVDFSGVDFGVLRSEENPDISFCEFNFPGNTLFDRVHFGKGDVSFHCARFGKGNVIFRDAVFGRGSVKFSNVLFGEGNVDFHKARFNRGVVDFKRAVFGDGNIFYTGVKFGEGGVDFSGVQFGVGNVDFRAAAFGKGRDSFSNVQFGKGDVYFNNVKFGEGGVTFLGAQFGTGNVKFNLAKFGDGEVSFSDALFGEGDVEFLGTQFGQGGVSFARTQIGNGFVCFSRAKFGLGNVNFSEMQLGNGDVSFRGAWFDTGRVSFQNTLFGCGDISFREVHFGDGDLSFQNTHFDSGNVDFGDAQFGAVKIRFTGAKFGEGTLDFTPQDILNCSGVDFSGASIDSVVIVSGLKINAVVNFCQASLKHPIDLDNTFIDFMVERLSENEYFSKAVNAGDSTCFRHLKKLAKESDDHERALDFFAKEKRSAYWHSITGWKLLLYYLYDWSSDYGRSIARPIVGLVLCWLLFAGIYVGLAPAENINNESFDSAMVLSIGNTIPVYVAAKEGRSVGKQSLYGETHIPRAVHYIGIGQGIISSVFMFLLGLGLRNRFRQ